MSEYEKLLADLEASVAKLDRRPLRKSLNANKARYQGNTRRAPDFGKDGDQPAGVDLLKAELAFNALCKSGALTDAQINEGRRRLMNLRPVEIIRVK